MRVLVWFSCGIASAVAAKKAVEKYGTATEVLYCDTLAYEHPDNPRFMQDVEKWIGVPIKILKSAEYTDIYDVFERHRFLRGPEGARCTIELKKRLRFDYQRADDLQIFGFTGDEPKRWKRFLKENPEVKGEWILKGISKAKCANIIKAANIEIPAMYRMGYPNNNCRGCVKAESIGYWTHIRKDWPDIFEKMAILERKLKFALNRIGPKKTRKPIFLDEIPPGVKPMKGLDIECGVLCQTKSKR